MYDKKRTRKAKEAITLDWILERVSEYDIYTAYIGTFKIGHIYNCPFRKDKNPSFGIYYSKRNQRLMFKDHGTGESGNIIKFVSLYTGITNYSDILYDIVEKTKITNKTKLTSSTEAHVPTDTVIGVIRQDLTQIDKDYWKQFNISQKTLKHFNVSSIKYYLCNGIVKGIYKDDNPMYAYKVFNAFKIYRPMADRYTKWRNNLTEYDIQGYEQLPETADILFITKSLKDVMCLHEMGYAAISPSSESTFIPQNVLEGLRKRFKRIIILFDRDVAGMRQSRRMSLKTGLEAMFIHKKWKSKDVSDAIKNNSFKEIKAWMTETLK